MLLVSVVCGCCWCSLFQRVYSVLFVVRATFSLVFLFLAPLSFPLLVEVCCLLLFVLSVVGVYCVKFKCCRLVLFLVGCCCLYLLPDVVGVATGCLLLLVLLLIVNAGCDCGFCLFDVVVCCWIFDVVVIVRGCSLLVFAVGVCCC